MGKPLTVFVQVAFAFLAALPTIAWPHGIGATGEADIPLAQLIPVQTDGILRLGARGRIDQGAAVSDLGVGKGFVLVYASRADARISRSILMQAWSSDGRSISAPAPLMPVESAITGTPFFVREAGTTHLVFTTADDPADKSLQSWRMALESGQWGAPVALDAVPGLQSYLSWPRWTDAGDDDIVLSFRDRKSILHWARGTLAGGISAPVSVPDARGAYVQVSRMGGGGWVASYQRREPDGYMVSWLRFSKDGETWSEPEALYPPIPPARPEVHDAFVLPRDDEGVDVYFVSASDRRTLEAPVGAFDLYRRSVFGSGRFGPVQQLTAPEGMEPLNPTAHRLPSGEVLVSFVDVLSRSRGSVGPMAEGQLAIFRLKGDAPSPGDGVR